MLYSTLLREAPIKPKPSRRWEWPWSKAARRAEALALFHEAWNYAHDHPEENSRGYDKNAFGHVHFWLSKVSD